MSLIASAAVLDIADLTVRRADALHEFSVKLPKLLLKQGEIIAITGQSGTGKSTLLEVLGLILKPEKMARFDLRVSSQGLPLSLCDVILQEDEVFLATLRSKAFGFVLQNGGLLPFLSVEDNIYLTRLNKGLTPKATFVEDAIARLKISHLRNKKPHQLSIGERQRVAFVRSIAHEPTIILADEPTAALDPYTADTLFHVMKEIAATLAISVVIVSHDWALIDKHGIKSIQGKSISPHESLFEYA